MYGHSKLPNILRSQLQCEHSWFSQLRVELNISVWTQGNLAFFPPLADKNKTREEIHTEKYRCASLSKIFPILRV